MPSSLEQIIPPRRDERVLSADYLSQRFQVFFEDLSTSSNTTTVDLTIIEARLDDLEALTEIEQNLVDYISETVLYRGETFDNLSLTSAPDWRIRKRVISGTGDSVTDTYAEGDNTFDKIWDNRASYTYL